MRTGSTFIKSSPQGYLILQTASHTQYWKGGGSRVDLLFGEQVVAARVKLLRTQVILGVVFTIALCLKVIVILSRRSFEMRCNLTIIYLNFTS